MAYWVPAQALLQARQALSQSHTLSPILCKQSAVPKVIHSFTLNEIVKHSVCILCIPYHCHVYMQNVCECVCESVYVCVRMCKHTPWPMCECQNTTLWSCFIPSAFTCVPGSQPGTLDFHGKCFSTEPSAGPMPIGAFAFIIYGLLSS